MTDPNKPAVIAPVYPRAPKVSGTRGPNTGTITASLPHGLIRALDAFCVATSTKRSHAVSKLLRDALNAAGHASDLSE